jgi:hypothetical protein
VGYAVLLFVVAIWVHYLIGIRIPTRSAGCPEGEGSDALDEAGA